jgi:hypothetical protein
VQGGTSTGQQVIESCEIRAKLPEQVSGGASSQGGILYNPVNPYCHDAPGITTRAMVGLALVAMDLYNVLNLDTVLVYNQTYVPNGSWLIPQTVLTARTAKLTVQYDF